MNKKEKYKQFIDYFTKNRPEAQTELQYSTPFELLVAVILSAQCTDKRVNLITPKLFSAYPTAEFLALATTEEVYALIKSISYPNNKAKHLVKMAQLLTDEFQGIVPSHTADLEKLPGVGRKTANVIRSVVFDAPAMAVDTHVFRVSKRLGLVSKKANTPLSVEKELLIHLPKKIISKAHHWLILHGRYVCLARNPKCLQCDLTEICAYNLTEKKKKSFIE